MTARDIIRALETVPEKRLRLVELARECVGKDGALDWDRLKPLTAEVEAAIQEAQAYMRQTETLRCALDRLVDR
ncbi:MAG: hypothetical protein AAB270_06835 [Chloroflexota bacterium]